MPIHLIIIYLIIDLHFIHFVSSTWKTFLKKNPSFEIVI